MNVALEPLVIQRTGSSPVFRYSCLHSHSHEVHGRFHARFAPHGTLSYPVQNYCRVFGGVLEPRYIVGAEPLDQ